MAMAPRWVNSNLLTKAASKEHSTSQADSPIGRQRNIWAAQLLRLALSGHALPEARQSRLLYSLIIVLQVQRLAGLRRPSFSHVVYPVIERILRHMLAKLAEEVPVHQLMEVPHCALRLWCIPAQTHSLLKQESAALISITLTGSISRNRVCRQ